MKRRRPESPPEPNGRPFKVRRRTDQFQPRVHDTLRPILRRVGTPDFEGFVPDPFQTEAIELVEKRDVVVSAPTGSGKTYIAVEAAKKVLAGGGRVWYASPLKALSNSKYLEFGKIFGPDRVGLLTGDHKVNAEAALIVGTTEILRNQLYDVMSRGEDLAVDLVVMDEAHYLGDPDRGVVWEEVIIYLPARVRLLLLSATVSNADEIADWLAYIRKEKALAVKSFERPVPLHPLFLFPDGLLTPLTTGRNLAPAVRHYAERNPSRGHRGGSEAPPYGRILASLADADLLPAIFFLKSRADCDQALSHCARAVDPDPEIAERRNRRLDELLDKYPFLNTHAHIKYLRGPGLAAHHAGHLPHYKLVVEQLMQDGLLTAIFSTSTVAAGVNFPARTVVIVQSDRFNGHEFSDLTATELLQMTGRAGRRGMDRIGFALIVPGPFQNIPLVHSLFGASPDPVRSQLQINFSMVLNLLLSHKPPEIKTLLELSLAAYQQGRSKSAKEMTRIMDRLMVLISAGSCGGAEEALHLFKHRSRLTAEAARLRNNRPYLAWDAALSGLLTTGRLFTVESGKRYCALEIVERRGRKGVLAAKVRGDVGLKKGRVDANFVPLDKVAGLLDAVLPIEPKTRPDEIVRLIHGAVRKTQNVLDHDRFLVETGDERLADLDGRLAALDAELAGQPCNDCTMFKYCLGTNQGEIQGKLWQLKKLESESQVLGRLLWSSFFRHLAMLKVEGFVSEDDELTEDGGWAAQLRLDHPLLIAAGIRADAWPTGNPALLAALVAPFVVDKELEPGESRAGLPEVAAAAWSKLEIAVEPLVRRLRAAGFDTPFLNPRAARAIYSWAGVGDWDYAVKMYGRDHGDMAMLVFRTADNLRQLASLKDTHPDLASTARAAVDLIIKEPVAVPL